MPALTRRFRFLYITLIFAASAIDLHSQVTFLSPLEDRTAKVGQNILIHIEFTSTGGGLPIRNQAYQGEHPDTSNPIPGLRGSGGADAFWDSPILTESMKVWFRLCNDFGCTDTNTVTITVEGEDSNPVADALGEASELGEGWVFSDWLGSYNVNVFPWIFHAEHGWMFVFDASVPDNVFLFDLSSEGWFWTNNTTYPSMFSFARSAWLFYFAGTSGPRDFVNLQTGEFLTIE